MLSQRWSVKSKVSPLTVYRRLRRLNPSPYMFLLEFGQASVVGSSPEMLVRVEKGEIETRPIAGTRPRGRDEAHDARLAAELLSDEKELAEHTMLVDLGRNDVGRVSVPGTVTVRDRMIIEKYSHVIHIVSSVVGKLDRRVSPIDGLAACFPAGTVSGAPKIRAMEIIDELRKRAPRSIRRGGGVPRFLGQPRFVYCYPDGGAKRRNLFRAGRGRNCRRQQAGPRVPRN